ncbi:AAA family ATPase [Myxosarcina sp. GI1(2024)]
MVTRKEQIDWLEELGLLPLPVVPLDGIEGATLLDDDGKPYKVAYYRGDGKPVPHKGKAPSYFNEHGQFRFASWRDTDTVEPEWFINDSVGVGTRCTNTIRYIDIDQHAEAVFNFFKGHLGDRLSGVRVERTPSGGYHIPIKLMSPLPSEIDNYIVPDVAEKEKIGELRGEHQMVVNAPTTGYTLLDDYTFGLLELEGYELEGLLGMYDQKNFNQATQAALNTKQEDGSNATVTAAKEIYGHVNDRGLDPVEADRLVQRVADVQGTAHKLDRVLKHVDPVTCNASGYSYSTSNSTHNVDGTTETPKKKERRLQLLGLDDISVDVDDRQYLVSELLPKGQLNLLHGESFTGKTLLMLDLMMAIITGDNFLGHNVEKGLVLHVDTDRQGKTRTYMTDRGFDKEVLGSDSKNYLTIGNGLSLPRDFDEFKDIILEVKPLLVVVDSLTTVTAIDVNKDEIATKVLQPLKEILEDNKVTGIIIHHDNKSKDVASQGKVKGSALIPARVDARWHLSLKPNGVRELRFEGHISHKLYELNLTPNCDDWISEGCFTLTLELSRQLEEASSNREKILLVIKDNPSKQFSNSDLATHLGVSVNTVRDNTNALSKDGTIKKTRDPNKKRGWLYFIESPVTLSTEDEVMENQKRQQAAINYLMEDRVTRMAEVSRTIHDDFESVPF